MQRIAAVVQAVQQDLGVTDKVDRIGLGAPGPMDLPRGYLVAPPQLPSWWDFPIRDKVSQLLNRPVSFLNDANAAAYGEFWLGSGRDEDSMVLLTLGTGVGGGIIVRWAVGQRRQQLRQRMRSHHRRPFSDGPALCLGRWPRSVGSVRVSQRRGPANPSTVDRRSDQFAERFVGRRRQRVDSQESLRGGGRRMTIWHCRSSTKRLAGWGSESRHWSTRSTRVRSCWAGQ